MSLECDVGIGRILGRKICGEIVETAIVSLSQEGDSLEEILGCSAVLVGYPVDEAEAVFTLTVLEKTELG